MRAPDEIRELEFTKTPMGGYKQSEVEAFLEEMAQDVDSFLRFKTDTEKNIKELTERLEQSKVSQDGLQKVLLCAQRVADEMTEEATKKAEEILVAAKREADELLSSIEEKVASAEENAKNLGAAAEHEATKIIADAVAESERLIKEAENQAVKITESAAKSVEEQKIQYDRIRHDIEDYKNAVGLLNDRISEALEYLPLDNDFSCENEVKETTENTEIVENIETEKSIVEETNCEIATEFAAETESFDDIKDEEVSENSETTEEEPEDTHEEIREEDEDEEETLTSSNPLNANDPEEEKIPDANEDQLTLGGFIIDKSEQYDYGETRKRKGRISFGEEDEEDDEDDDEESGRRLPFFRKRTK